MLKSVDCSGQSPMDKDNKEAVRRFAALFRGSPRGHGNFNAQHEGVAAGKKVEGPRKTVHKPATLAHFEQHLAGTYGLGAVPLLLDPPGHTVWGAIDIDIYTGFDLPAFARMIAARGFPLVVCRSKSGGPHCYVFLTEPVQASIVRAVLGKWAASLGFPTAEVFPKQDALADQRHDECVMCHGAGCATCGSTGKVENGGYFGNWINLPFQSGDRSTRYALDADGKALTLDEFLVTAEMSRIDQATLEDFEPMVAADEAPQDGPQAPGVAGGTDGGEFPEAPPCVVRMAQSGVVEGSDGGGRNTALFNAAIYLRRMDPEHLAERTNKFNQEHLSPPLTPGDVHVIVRSVSRKDYSYQCNAHPLKGLCDRKTCELRKWGVLFGRSQAAPGFGLEFGQLTKVMTDPASWEWVVNGTLVKFTTKEFTAQKAFLERILDRTPTSLAPALMRPREWDAFWKSAKASAVVVQPPEDATTDGQLMFHLSNFCTARARAKTLDEMLLHKAYFDEPAQRECFMVADFLAYLIQQRVSGASERTIYVALRERDLRSHEATLKGKDVEYWSIPKLNQQTKKFDVVVPDDDVPF